MWNVKFRVGRSACFIGCLVLIAFVFSGCSEYRKVSKSTISKFSLCYSALPKELDERIRVEGYYSMNPLYTSTKPFDEFILFENGMVVTAFDLTTKDQTELLPKYLNRIQLGQKGAELFAYKRNALWGIYSVEGDRLKIQGLINSRKGVQGGGLVFVQIIFEIQSQNSLIELERNYFIRNEAIKRDLTEESKIATFVPLNNMPSADSWLLYEDWFWCDKEEFESWKRTNGVEENKKLMSSYRRFIKDK